MTPEQVLAQYVLSAWMLGAHFGGEPYPGYLDQTGSAALADLRHQGFTVVPAPSPSGGAPLIPEFSVLPSPPTGGAATAPLPSPCTATDEGGAKTQDTP
jgi:hypothetical protein